VENINQYLEHTRLNTNISDRDVDKIVQEAIEFSFVGVCIPPFWVKRASRDLRNTDIQLVTVIGFPLGYQMTETKIAEIDMAIKTGADELDIVMNISAFKIGMPWVKIELAKCAQVIHSHEKIIKVIIETAYLTDHEIEKAALICSDAGADYIKTSTGFASSGAQVKDVELLRKILPSNVGIKASGGIKTRVQAEELIESGADRIGTSSAIEIVKQV